MRRVVIESPFAGELRLNRRYLDTAIRDCLRKGEAPFASHGMYTTALNDSDTFERALGISAGRVWYGAAELIVVYRDLGLSPGMVDGIAWAQSRRIPIEYRNIEGWVDGKQ